MPLGHAHGAIRFRLRPLRDGKPWAELLNDYNLAEGRVLSLILVWIAVAPALAMAGAIGFVGNAVAARVRSRAGERLGSAALIADGDHARVDASVSGGVVLSAILVGLGWPLADPLIALAITIMIGHIAWGAWETIRGDQH